MAKKIPMRQCIGCGEMKSKKELLRILRTAEGDLAGCHRKKERLRRISLLLKRVPVKGDQNKGAGAFFSDEDPAGGIRKAGEGV